MRIALCLVFGVSVALAQAPSGKADQLFQEGLALFDKGQFDEACAKFEQSLALDPKALGTVMNLGRCNESRGKLATALAAYREAYDRATEMNAGPTRDKAKERIAAILPQVPVVTLARKGAPLAGEQLRVDGKVVASDKTELPLDPGHHTVVLSAPGRVAFEKPIDLAASAKLTVELPVLDLEAPKQPPVATPGAASSRRTYGKIATFGGAGLAVVGGVLAVVAKRSYDKQFDDPDGSGPALANCSDGSPAICNADGQSATDRARRIGTTATIVGAVGVAAAATGLVLWLTAPAETATAHARLVPTGRGFAVIGRF